MQKTTKGTPKGVPLVYLTLSYTVKCNSKKWKAHINPWCNVDSTYHLQKNNINNSGQKSTTDHNSRNKMQLTFRLYIMYNFTISKHNSKGVSLWTI